MTGFEQDAKTRGRKASGKRVAIIIAKSTCSQSEYNIENFEMDRKFHRKPLKVG